MLGPVGQSTLAGGLAFGAVGLTIALGGLGVPFLLAAALAAVAAGLVHFAAVRRPMAGNGGAPNLQPGNAAKTTEDAMQEQLKTYRAHTSALRHDLRGVLSPALMMSDRLLNHPDPAVQRAGTAVVRSIDRATALLTESKELMTPDVLANRSAPAAKAEPAVPELPRQ
jgi:signal transduction histidine kinase